MIGCARLLDCPIEEVIIPLDSIKNFFVELNSVEICREFLKFFSFHELFVSDSLQQLNRIE